MSDSAQIHSAFDSSSFAARVQIKKDEANWQKFNEINVRTREAWLQDLRENYLKSKK